MTTRSEAATLIDNAAAAGLSGIAPLLFGNTADLAYSAGDVSYARVRTHFSDSNQFELGNPARSRKWGSVVFTVYVRRGKGDGDRNLIADAIEKTFRSKQFGGVTFLNMREMPNQDTENWCLTGIQIPFHFVEV